MKKKTKLDEKRSEGGDIEMMEPWILCAIGAALVIIGAGWIYTRSKNRVNIDSAINVKGKMTKSEAMEFMKIVEHLAEIYRG